MLESRYEFNLTLTKKKAREKRKEKPKRKRKADKLAAFRYFFFYSFALRMFKLHDFLVNAYFLLEHDGKQCSNCIGNHRVENKAKNRYKNEEINLNADIEFFKTKCSLLFSTFFSQCSD